MAKELEYCNECGEFVQPEKAGVCQETTPRVKQIVPCHCCGGWGRHEGWEGRPICTTCGGKRMLIKTEIYEQVVGLNRKEGRE